MNIRVSLILVVFILALASCSGISTGQTNKLVSETNFSTSWNTHCGDFQFDENTEILTTTTLGDMYTGEDFAKDVGLIDIEISQDLGFASLLDGASGIELYGFFDNMGEDFE